VCCYLLDGKTRDKVSNCEYNILWTLILVWNTNLNNLNTSINKHEL
jgi:hypothetical protein